ncbi:MAG: type II toxin-antitoxin system YafQ family toxin [Spirochaetia bacterium]|nr:type II toxin-antitoxin system YafQ family toxin [Spirochaetia bacterium]
MYTVFRTNSFKKDIKKLKKRNKDIEKLIIVMHKLINGIKLEEKYKDHQLIGNYTGFRECHIEPDWLLIYRIDKKSIFFTRTGTHNDLF